MTLHNAMMKLDVQESDTCKFAKTKRRMRTAVDQCTGLTLYSILRNV